VQLTETCNAAPPQLITQVTTTVGPAAEVAQLATIQQGLQAVALLPAAPLVASAYSSGASLSRSQTLQQIALIGPMALDRQWQAKAGDGFALAQFQLDMGGPGRHLPAGTPACWLVRHQQQHARPADSCQRCRDGLYALPRALALHARRHPATQAHAAGAHGAGSDPGGAPTTAVRGVGRDLRPPRRH